jgi:phospholipid N-methyltransferase
MKTSGSITPSSKYLVQKCLDHVDFKTAKVILEFGVGDGVITQEILEKVNADCQVIAIEINKNLFEYSQKKFADAENLSLHLASAFNFDEVLKKEGIDKVDYVISSLPLSLFSQEEIDDLFEKVPNHLSDKGAFVQYQYSIGKYGYLKKIFDKVSVDFTIRNAPPALIFTCMNLPIA